MAVTNGYCTAAELKAAVQVDDVVDDVAIDRAISTTSRLIDGHCRRRFWSDATDVARTYTAADSRCLILSGEPQDVDVQSVTAIATDIGGDGTYETAWTSSDWVLAPLNAAANGRPYSEVIVRPTSSQRFPVGVPAGVKITGKFGWAAIPDDVREACVRQASIVFKSVREGAAPIITLEGLAGGTSRFLDGQVQLILRPYVRMVAG
ncbi:MAG: hypothetical protein M3O70_08875 [Actinomycetota bacterium]|nr:hypothetical protein [Actinomycetota bacterium]